MPGSTDIIVPVCDEEATIEELVERLRAACPEAGLIFVDNASTDRTVERLSRFPDLRLLRHERDLGYGRSILDGLAAARAERVAIIDADLEYWPEDLPPLLDALDSAEAVFGSRLLEGGGRTSALPLTRTLGNRLVTALYNVLFSQHLTDLYTGIRTLRRGAVPLGSLHCQGFEFVLELSARLAQSGARIVEVPARYTPRRTGTSKMRHLPEVVKFAYHLVRLRSSPGPRA